MAKECLDNCPKITQFLDQMEGDNLIAGIAPWHPNIEQGKDLVKLCEDSYDCPGPHLENVPVYKGIFHPRVEYHEIWVCGLDSNKLHTDECGSK